MRSFLVAAAAAAVAAQPVMPPYPLQSTAEAVKQASSTTPLVTPTGLKRADYLTTINGVVQYFRQFQNSTGHIIDPYRGLETQVRALVMRIPAFPSTRVKLIVFAILPHVSRTLQYATPCFAFACATAWSQGLDASLLPNCTSALTAATTELATKTCADGHCVFFMKPVMFAYRVLANRVDGATKATWDTNLQTMSPDNDFGFPTNNWGLVGTLDMLRTTYITQFGNASWWMRMLDFQLGEPSVYLTPNGLYQDHTGASPPAGMPCAGYQCSALNPLPYDTFPVSGYLTVMLREGYNLSHAPLLQEATMRAGWTHMLMQTPWGEIPTGGRSSQHSWNEAVSALAYEIEANKYAAAGDAQAACMFQRAAHKSHAALIRWINGPQPGQGNASMAGAFQIVKNWYPPAQRWGYEEYSYLSQYNLLPASMLAAAWTYADVNDAIPECAAPSDLGGFVIQLPEHRLVIASLGGVYLQVETGADPKYEPTGFHRLHINTCGVGSPASCVKVNPLLGPSAGPPYYPPAGAPPQGVAIGPWWATADAPANMTSLGSLSFTDVSAVTLVPGWNTNGSVLTFSVEYYLLSRGLVIQQDYTLSVAQGGAQPTVSITHSVQSMGGAAMLARALAVGGLDLSKLAPGHLHEAMVKGVFSPEWRQGGAAGATLTRFGLQFPAFRFDGQTNTSLSVDSSSNTVTIAGPSTGSGPAWGSIQHSVEACPPGHTYVWTNTPGEEVVSRNGLVSTVWVEVTGIATQSPSLTSTVTGING